MRTPCCRRRRTDSRAAGLHARQVLEQAGLEPEEYPPREEVETKLERLTRERDNMGPVNLRAEQDRELQEQIGSMIPNART